MASLNLNKVVLAGHLAETPELKQTAGSNPVSVCKVRLIINRPKKQDGTQSGIDAFDVIVWRGTAEFVCRYFRKGSAMCVTGSLRNRSYEKNGETRWVTEIVADEVNFVDSSTGTSQGGENAQKSGTGDVNGQAQTNTEQKNSAPQNAPQSAQQAYIPQAYQPVSGDDDLPF